MGYSESDRPAALGQRDVTKRESNFEVRHRDAAATWTQTNGNPSRPLRVSRLSRRVPKLKPVVTVMMTGTGSRRRSDYVVILFCILLLVLRW